jgi:hypothetical protein
MAEPIVKIGGVRYRREDAIRLGLIEGTGKTVKKGADDGGTVSGDASGSGDTDKPVSDKPKPITSSRQGKQ